MGNGCIFITLALTGSGQLHAPTALTPGTHWTGGWVGPRDSLDDVKKRKFLTLPGLELRPLGCPAYSQSLYRLHYPVSLLYCTENNVKFLMPPPLKQY
jgi:hypothetical protein